MPDRQQQPRSARGQCLFLGAGSVGFAPNGEVWIHNDRDGAVHVIDGRTDTVIKTCFPVFSPDGSKL
jgi:hypothetical protein